MKITNRLFSILSLLTLLCVSSCDQIREDYKIERKQTKMEQSGIYIDGFLQKSIPVYQGNANEPADRLVIPVSFGFGRTLEFRFLNDSLLTGIRVKDSTYTLLNQGDKQQLYFRLTGTPINEGLIPISFNIFENGVQVFTTMKQAINIWSQNASRPPRNQIATAEKPVVFLKAEFNWINQKTTDWLNMAPSPSTTFKLNGISYGPVLNIRYNSISFLDKSVIPEITTVTFKNHLDTTQVITQKIPTLLLPTTENLAAHPEWFTCEDGTVSTSWTIGKDYLMIGSNSKPVSMTYYDPNTQLITSGTSQSAPLSSLSWGLNAYSTTNPYGSYITKSGKYKVWIKFKNNDPATDVMQYFPKNPGTGESGWVPVEFEVKENPLLPFEIKSTDNSDWRPTADKQVKAVRGELLVNGKSYSLTSNVAIGVTPVIILRVYFISMKGSTVGTNFKLNQSAGYNVGFNSAEVISACGTGSILQGGISNHGYRDFTHTFAKDSLNQLYDMTYTEFNMSKVSKITNPAGDYTVWCYLLGSTGNVPQLPYNDLKFPVIINVK